MKIQNLWKWRKLPSKFSPLILSYIYIYAFSRRFYPKRLTLHSSYSYLLSLGIEPMILTFASAMLYQLSYRKAASVLQASLAHLHEECSGIYHNWHSKAAVLFLWFVTCTIQLKSKVYIHLAESAKCWLFYQVRGIIKNACYCLFSTDLNKIFHIKDVYM